MVLKSYCKGLAMDRDHVMLAYDAWRAATAGHKNAWRIKEEYGSVDALVDEVANEISSRSITLRPIYRYEHVEPTNGKRRTIGVESVKQQVLDYAVVLALKPMLDAKMGYWQVASVPGKGQIACRNIMRKWVKEGGYHVKLDVRKCYPSISHDVVMRILRKYVKSADVLYVAEAILATYDQGGLEIGSYFSLQMANLVLSFGYHHVEGLHKERRGKKVALVSHQLWFMDDVLLTGPDKRNLKMAARSLERYMRKELGLAIKPWKICKTGDAEPLDMGGFVVREGRVTMRPAIFMRATRAFRRFARRHTLRLAYRVCSYWGWLRHIDADNYIRRNRLNESFSLARRIISRAGKERTWTETAALPS